MELRDVKALLVPVFLFVLVAVALDVVAVVLWGERCALGEWVATAGPSPSHRSGSG
jgi:hypothetical protein